MFKKGDKVKCINAGACRDMFRGSDITEGKLYEVMSDQDDDDNVKICNDAERNQGYYPQRFEAVAPAEPVLKPGMRVVFADRNSSGGGGVVVRDATDELAISCDEGGWVNIHYDETRRFYKEYNIAEVYEAPNFWDAKDPTARGALIWQAQDAAKLAAIAAAAADAAVAEAEAELEAAKAARAAL